MGAERGNTMCLTNNIIPTSVGVNTFSTVPLRTLTTYCDGGALMTTQRTHFDLILSLILRGGRVALVRPNMRGTWPPSKGQPHQTQRRTHGCTFLQSTASGPLRSPLLPTAAHAKTCRTWTLAETCTWTWACAGAWAGVGGGRLCSRKRTERGRGWKYQRSR